MLVVNFFAPCFPLMKMFCVVFLFPLFNFITKVMLCFYSISSFECKNSPWRMRPTCPLVIYWK